MIIDFGVASFGPQTSAILKFFCISEFGGRSSSSRDPGIIPGQKKLFQVLKETKCFPFPLQPFLLHTDFHADKACRGRRRQEEVGRQARCQGTTRETQDFSQPTCHGGKRSACCLSLCQIGKKKAIAEKCISSQVLVNSLKCHLADM